MYIKLMLKDTEQTRRLVDEVAHFGEVIDIPPHEFINFDQKEDSGQPYNPFKRQWLWPKTEHNLIRVTDQELYTYPEGTDEAKFTWSYIQDVQGNRIYMEIPSVNQMFIQRKRVSIEYEGTVSGFKQLLGTISAGCLIGGIPVTFTAEGSERNTLPWGEDYKTAKAEHLKNTYKLIAKPSRKLNGDQQVWMDEYKQKHPEKYHTLKQLHKTIRKVQRT